MKEKGSIVRNSIESAAKFSERRVQLLDKDKIVTSAEIRDSVMILAESMDSPDFLKLATPEESAQFHMAAIWIKTIQKSTKYTVLQILEASRNSSFESMVKVISTDRLRNAYKTVELYRIETEEKAFVEHLTKSVKKIEGKLPLKEFRDESESLADLFRRVGVVQQKNENDSKYLRRVFSEIRNETIYPSYTPMIDVSLLNDTVPEVSALKATSATMDGEYVGLSTMMEVETLFLGVLANDENEFTELLASANHGTFAEVQELSSLFTEIQSGLSSLDSLVTISGHIAVRKALNVWGTEEANMIASSLYSSIIEVKGFALSKEGVDEYYAVAFAIAEELWKGDSGSLKKEEIYEELRKYADGSAGQLGLLSYTDMFETWDEKISLSVALANFIQGRTLGLVKEEDWEKFERASYAVVKRISSARKDSTGKLAIQEIVGNVFGGPLVSSLEVTDYKYDNASPMRMTDVLTHTFSLHENEGMVREYPFYLKEQSTLREKEISALFADVMDVMVLGPLKRYTLGLESIEDLIELVRKGENVPQIFGAQMSVESIISNLEAFELLQKENKFPIAPALLLPIDLEKIPPEELFNLIERINRMDRKIFIESTAVKFIQALRRVNADETEINNVIDSHMNELIRLIPPKYRLFGEMAARSSEEQDALSRLFTLRISDNALQDFAVFMLPTENHYEVMKIIYGNTDFTLGDKLDIRNFRSIVEGNGFDKDVVTKAYQYFVVGSRFMLNALQESDDWNKEEWSKEDRLRKAVAVKATRSYMPINPSHLELRRILYKALVVDSSRQGKDILLEPIRNRARLRLRSMNSRLDKMRPIIEQLAMGFTSNQLGALRLAHSIVENDDPKIKSRKIPKSQEESVIKAFSIIFPNFTAKTVLLFAQVIMSFGSIGEIMRLIDKKQAVPLQPQKVNMILGNINQLWGTLEELKDFELQQIHISDDDIQKKAEGLEVGNQGTVGQENIAVIAQKRVREIRRFIENEEVSESSHIALSLKRLLGDYRVTLERELSIIQLGLEALSDAKKGSFRDRHNNPSNELPVEDVRDWVKYLEGIDNYTLGLIYEAKGATQVGSRITERLGEGINALYSTMALQLKQSPLFMTYGELSSLKADDTRVKDFWNVLALLGLGGAINVSPIKLLNDDDFASVTLVPADTDDDGDGNQNILNPMEYPNKSLIDCVFSNQRIDLGNVYEMEDVLNRLIVLIDRNREVLNSIERKKTEEARIKRQKQRNKEEKKRKKRRTRKQRAVEELGIPEEI